MKFYATQAREPFPWYQHEQIGYNYRLSNVSAGIGRGQMRVVDNHIAHRRAIHRLYTELLAGLPGISLPCGIDSSGLPIGVQMIGQAFSEKTLIRAAYSLEQTRSYERPACVKGEN